MATKPSQIAEIVRYLKTVPSFRLLQDYINSELERNREMYENSEANEFLRGRVSVLKQLKADLEK